jgi:hypothetical protein
MRKLILLLIFPCAAHAQILGGNSTAGGGGGAISFNQYTFVSETSGTLIASITSPSITIPSNAHVIVFCRSGEHSGTTIVASSSPSNTFTALTSDSTTSLTEQMSYALTVGTGATTFTCTPPASQGFQAMVVMVWTGGIGTFDTQGNGNMIVGNLSITGITTSSSVIALACGSQASSSGIWSAGTMGGNAATLGGVSSGALGNAADSGCEYYITSPALSSATVTMTSTSTASGVGTMASFK